MLGTALDQDRSVVFLGTIGQEKLKLVHTFEVPFQSAIGPIELERHFAAGAFDHSADFQMALGATGELNQGPDIIFVGYGGTRGVRVDREVRSLPGDRRGSRTDICLTVGDHPLNGAGEHVGHVRNMRHEVPQRPVPRQLVLETP